MAIFALVVIYGASFALKISNGMTKTVDNKIYNIRLQILNGCGTRGAADRAAKVIPKLTKLPLEVSVVETFDFKPFDVKKSFVISREQDLTMAKALARQFGLDEENVVYQPIEDNYRSVNVTMVLGEDYAAKILKTSR